MEKQIKFTGPFKTDISFDRSEIRKKIFKPTLRQARRFKNVYDALIRELYEEGCLTSAKYFQMLVEKECVLYQRASIRDRISDEQNLLLGLFDSCKIAEHAALSGRCDGPDKCTRLLLQCILMLEKYGQKYDWILWDCFTISIKIATKVCQADEVSKEYLCQIYYKFGVYQMKIDLEEAVKYLGKSFELARGTNWTYEEGTKSVKFSSLIAKTYATALINFAKELFSNSPENALSQAQKALVILAGEGIEQNKGVYIKVNLDMADFQLKAGNYETSLSLLEYVAEYIKSFSHESKFYLEIISRYKYLKGKCFKCLKKYGMALVELYESLNIKRRLNMKHDEGVVLLDIAKTHIERGRSEFSLAESCLLRSKEIFLSLNETLNTKKTSYIMANLQTQSIQPMFLDLIKSLPSHYCDKYELIRWKTLCLPFWHEMQYKSIDCILKPSEISDDKYKNI